MSRLRDLPNLNHVTLEIEHIEQQDLKTLLRVCSRLSSLKIEKCRVSHHQSEVTWIQHQIAYDSGLDFALKELIVSTSSSMSLLNIIRRCPSLEVLRFYRSDYLDATEDNRIRDLAECFASEHCFPALKHLDLAVNHVWPKSLSDLLEKVRCLRGFQSIQSYYVSPCFVDFQHHFSTLTIIEAKSRDFAFWPKVMTSCSALVKAKKVVLTERDILRDTKWVCTGLEQLEIEFLPTSAHSSGVSGRKDVEISLFQRISTLQKLHTLYVGIDVDHATPDFERHQKDVFYVSLQTESWELLSYIKTLKSLELDEWFIGEDEQLEVTVKGILMLKQLQDFSLPSRYDCSSEHLNQVRKKGVSIKFLSDAFLSY